MASEKGCDMGNVVDYVRREFHGFAELPFGEGPLISVGNQGGIPIGTVDWREDGIAVGRYDTGEMVLIPI